MLGCVGFIYTLEIVANYLKGINRDRLCGTNALISVTSAIFEAVKPLEEVQTQSCPKDPRFVVNSSRLVTVDYFLVSCASKNT